MRFDVYSRDPDGEYINTNADTDTDESSGADGFGSMMESNRSAMFSMFGGVPSSAGAENFEQLMSGADGAAVSPVVTDACELLHGAWPQRYDEVVLVLDRHNSVSTPVLYQLGFITAEELEEATRAIRDGGQPEQLSWDYEEVCGHTFTIVPTCDRYLDNGDGTFTYADEDSPYLEGLLEDGLKLKIVGVVRPAEDADDVAIYSAIGYTGALTDYVIDHTDKSPVVTAQRDNDGVNVLTGLAFEARDDEAKAEVAAEYISGLNVSDKASLYTVIMYFSSSADAGQQGTQTPDAGQQMPGGMPGGMTGGQGAGMTDETALAAAMDMWLEYTPDEEVLVSLYDEYISGGSYDENMADFGCVSYDAPYSISLYADSFEDKELIADCITRYNEGVDEDSRIVYTDYVALLTSSLTSIVDVISYVLIAFVAVSLVVSCIMIGIITHISVLERTKEIGILRALGASRRNIAQVFNAETFIIGFCAGLLGVVISALLTIPINAIVAALVDSQDLRAVLPVPAGVVLVLISMGITVLAGLLPARKAAKKDPVEALRTE